MQDPVINIRLRLCGLFPSLKSLLKLPADRVLLQNLELTVRKLIAQERDPDVAQSMRTAVTEMDRIEVAMETVSSTIIVLVTYSILLAPGMVSLACGALPLGFSFST